MNTITVLRLEDENGGGCFDVADMQDYTTAAVKAGLMTPEEDEWDHFHTAERGYPGPWNDDSLRDAMADKPFDYHEEGVRFGFPSREVAAEWFPPCMADALERNGQTLTIWEVPEEHVAIGDRQVVFDRDRAHLVERLPVSALWDDTTNQLALPLAA
jgi:hypothetical protein